MGCEQLHQNPKEDGGKQSFVSVANEELPENVQFHPLNRSQLLTFSLIWHMMPKCLTKEGLQIRKKKEEKNQRKRPQEKEKELNALKEEEQRKKKMKI